MTINEIKKLASALSLSKKNPSLTYSYGEGDSKVTLSAEAMNETLRKELYELCQSRNGYEKNKYDLFELIQQNVDLKLPAEVQHFFEGFAVTQQFANGDKPEFVLRHDPRNLRARQFITKASPAGTYEVFHLAKDKKIVPEISAVGGAAQIPFEDFLSGRIDWNEMTEVIRLGIEDRIYDEILACLATVENNLPAANKSTATAFDAATFERVLNVVSAYGTPTIFCTNAYARLITEGTDWASAEEKLARRNIGYLANYKGAKIVVIPQSFKDTNNTIKVVDDSKAYIMPAGRDPIFYVAMEGDTQLRDINDNADWSIEIQAYKRFGVVAVTYNDIGVSTITNLA